MQPVILLTEGEHLGCSELRLRLNDAVVYDHPGGSDLNKGDPTLH